MGYCVLCKSNEVVHQKSDNTSLLNFKNEISELLFFEDYKLGDWQSLLHNLLLLR